MGRARRIESAVGSVIELRAALRLASDSRQRASIERVELTLRSEIGDSVPKAVAARVLEVSVPALGRWVARGRLREIERDGSSRAELDAEALLDLATEVARLRESGYERAVLATAFSRLAAARRVLEAAELSLAATTIAAASRAT